MNARVPLIVATISGLAVSARGQELVRVSYSWIERNGFSQAPVTNPNSVVDPNETADIGVHLVALINGSSAVGQTTTYTPPPPPGVGTVRGIASFDINLRGDGASAAGTWGFRGVASIFSTNISIGIPLSDGSGVTDIHGSQGLPPGATANSINPIASAFRGRWWPASYTPRTVNFRVDTNSLGADAGVSLAVQFGTALLDPNDPNSAYALYTLKNFPIDDGGGLAIQIAPAPVTGALFIGAGLFVTPRRRRTP